MAQLTTVWSWAVPLDAAACSEAGLALPAGVLSVGSDLLALPPVALLLLQHPLSALPHHPPPRHPVRDPACGAGGGRATFGAHKSRSKESRSSSGCEASTLGTDQVGAPSNVVAFCERKTWRNYPTNRSRCANGSHLALCIRITWRTFVNTYAQSLFPEILIQSV